MTKKLTKFTLINGIDVVLYPINEVRAVTFQVGLPVGSSIEAKDKVGTLHFLEHMMFRGSGKYPTPRDVAVAAEEIGVSMNAWVGSLSTTFWFKAPDTHIKEASEFIFDTLTNPQFNQESVDNSKSVILTEQRNHWDIPENVFYDNVVKENLGSKHPYTRRGFGDESVVENMTLQLVKETYDNYYIPHNFKISVAGNFEVEKMKKILKNTFGKWTRKGNKVNDYVPDAPRRKKFFYIKNEKRKQVIYSLTFPVSGYKEVGLKKRLTMSIFNFLLGGSFTSELYQRLREELGIVYYANSHLNQWPHAGFLEISASFGLEDSKVAQEEILKVLKKVKQKGFDKKDFLRAKEFMSTQTLISFSGVNKISGHFLSHMLDGFKLYMPEDYVEKVEAIKHEEVNKLVYDTINFSKVGAAFMTDAKAIDKTKLKQRYEQL